MMDEPQDCRPTEVGSRDDGKASLSVIMSGSVWTSDSAELVGSSKGRKMEPETAMKRQKGQFGEERAPRKRYERLTRRLRQTRHECSSVVDNLHAQISLPFIVILHLVDPFFSLAQQRNEPALCPASFKLRVCAERIGYIFIIVVVVVVFCECRVVALCGC